MGLVFDLAEAINIVWGAASGEAATSIRDILKDRAFRAKLIEDFERSAVARTGPAALKVAKSPQFLRWLDAGAESPLEDFLTDDQLKSFGVDNSTAAAEVGGALRESVRNIAIQFASWAERQLLADTSNLQTSLGTVQEILTTHLLGRSSRAFATHGRYVALLQRRRGGQTSDAQVYIPPTEDHPAHPDNLWRRLSEGDGASILIRGVGGSGKTRLLLEVASRAQRSDWHVIHVLGHVPATVDDLTTIVLASDRSVLLVMDYPNELDGIDLTDLNERLIPDASAVGIQLALLAAARPGWLATSPPLGPFEIVGLDNSDEHQGYVSHMIALDIAPTAAAQLRDHEFRRLIGARPMIATMIARELEQRALRAALTSAETSSIRSGNLTDWLRRRFDEDGYASERPRKLAESRVLPPPLCIATAITVATPNDLETILWAGGEAARAMNETNPSRFARRTLDHLLEAGWIAGPDDQLASIHDTVVDHLIAEVVESDIYNGRTTYGEAAFTAIAGRLSATASLLSHLRRYILDPSGNDSISREDRTKYVVDWVRESFPHIREAVLETSDGRQAATIRLLLDARLWGQETCDQVELCWQAWLDRHGATPTASAVLASVLHHVTLRRTEWAQVAIVTWLTANGTTPEASTVLAPLLMDATLRRKEWAQTALRNWLPDNGVDLEASTILARMIEYAGLGRTFWVQAAVQTWLAQHGTTANARVLLAKMLEQTDLRRTTWALPAIQAWLAQHGTNPNARALLVRMLEHTDLQSTEWVQPAIETWLAQHGTTLEARALLEHSGLQSTEWAQPAIQTWLAQHGTTLEARALLEHTGLETTEWAEPAIQAWLAEHGTTLEARALLEHTDSRTTEWAGPAIQAWLAEHGTTLEARALLERTDLQNTEWAQPAIQIWLTEHGTTYNARPLLVRLLTDADLRRAEWVQTAARTWLTLHGTTPDARAVLHSLLFHAALGREDWVQAAADAWLAQHGNTSDAKVIKLRAAEVRRTTEGPWAALLGWTEESPSAEDEDGPGFEGDQ